MKRTAAGKALRHRQIISLARNVHTFAASARYSQVQVLVPSRHLNECYLVQTAGKRVSKTQFLKSDGPSGPSGPNSSQNDQKPPEKDPNSPDNRHQQKLANLGSMIDDLKELVPNLLRTSLPKSLVLPEIMLRVSPSHFELLNLILPNIKGHVSYYAACKALQIFLTSVVLNPQVKIHVHAIRTSTFPEPNTVYSHSTKVYMRWSTCQEGCSHLTRNEDTSVARDSHSTARAKLGSHRWSGFDPDKVIDKDSWWVTSSLADLTKGLIGLKKDDLRLERVILGVFIFELSEDNSQVLVHTIEDMTIVERTEEQDVGGKLRVC